MFILLRELENQLNLLSSAGNCILDGRDQRYIDYSVKELLIQRVFQIAAGYEDCNDCNDLREDMILKICAGRFPQSDDDLASQPTMSRLENSVTRSDLFRLGKCLVDNFIDSYSETPSVIILDCDDANNDTYGQQELALFNNYYNEYLQITQWQKASLKLLKSNSFIIIVTKLLKKLNYLYLNILNCGIM